MNASEGEDVFESLRMKARKLAALTHEVRALAWAMQQLNS